MNGSGKFHQGRSGIVMRGLLLPLLLTVHLQVAAQFQSVINFSVQQGLPSSEVYEIYQDKKGFLWFATDNGVARYDGNEFEVFHVKDGLTDPVVFGFFEDNKDRVWFRTFSSRLCYLDGDQIKPYAYNKELIKHGEYPFINFLYDGKSDELWFTLSRLFGRIDKSGNVHTEEAPSRSSFIKTINGKLLQGTDIIYSVKKIIIDNKEYPIELTDTTEYKSFNAIQCGEKIFVSIYKDLFEYDQKTVKRVYSSEHPIISLSRDKKENIWVGFLNDGVEKLSDLQKPGKPRFLKNQSVTKVFQDNASGLWFSTLESGVFYIPNFEIENYSSPPNSLIERVLALKDTVLVGDQKGKLFFFDAGTRKLLSTKVYGGAIYSLHRDSMKNVWVSAGLDLIRYDSKFSSKNVYPRLVATSMSNGRNKSVWTYGGIRLTHFDKGGRPIKRQTRRINYRTMLIDDSVIYFAGRTGLHVRDLEMNLLESPAAFSEMKISQVESINDSILVLATQGNGLFVTHKKTWHSRQFDTNHQFVANNIYCLTKMDSTLWMGTEKGLIGINIREMLKNEFKFYHISTRTGLINDKVNFILPIRNTLWAFTDNGWSIIPRSIAEAAPIKPTFYLKQIITGFDTLSSRHATSAPAITLPYDNNYLTFRFGYISFTGQDIFMRYRISRESEWTPTRERTLQFISLAPGEYLFELEYSMDNTHWFSGFAPTAFTIDSPWWMKWYTLLGVLALILLAGFVYFRYRQSIYKQKNHYLSIINTHQQKLIQSEIETLERERKRIAAELHDGVGTNLTAIKLMVNQLLKNHRDPKTADVEEQFQIAIRELKDIIYGLTPPSLNRYGLFTALQNYISKLNTSLSPEITLQIFGNEIKNYEFNIMVFRIVQELITNSIKHSSAKNITIHINSFEDMLNIVYEDDGVGFLRDPVRGGLGLDNIESRIQSMNGTFKFDSGDHGISYTIDIPLHSISQTA